MNIDLSTLKAHAQGRWHHIHATLGIPTELLNPHKHQPCPHCGGKDRFRYTDYQGYGGFICNQCTPQGGSGLDLIMLVLGYTFAEAVHAVAGVLGIGKPVIDTPTPIKPPVSVSKPIQDKQAVLASLLAQTALIDDSSPVACYLQQRGLDWQRIASHTSTLRFHAALPYWTPSTQSKPLHLGNFPAMIASITTPAGELMGIHCTYLMQSKDGWSKLVLAHPQTGEPLPAKKMQSRYPQALTGAAVQLHPINATLGIAEGIETALAAHQLFQIPVWACLSAHGVQSFAIPPEVKLLVIFADHDEAGINASHKLERRALQQGLQVKYWQAETPDFDVLDELNRLKNKAAPNHFGQPHMEN